MSEDGCWFAQGRVRDVLGRGYSITQLEMQLRESFLKIVFLF